ncbi:MAG: hypothetical protein ACQESK_04675 [Bacteroidota bacterium]
MGIRLIFLMLILLLVSCKTEREITDVGSTDKEYVRAFKKSVLMGCLNGITNQEFGESLRNKYNDIGLYTEVAILYHSEVKLASKKGNNYAETLKPVSYPDVEGQYQGYSGCVDYAFYNQEIDSIAKAKYRNLKNGKMEYSSD